METKNERSLVLLDSKIFCCNSMSDHPAVYMMDKTHITNLDEIMFQKLNSATYWQSENTTWSPGVITYPQFVTFDMTKVFLVHNILAIFISPNDNPSTCYLDR